MAKLVYEDNEVEVADNTPIQEAAKELGIPFSCEDGLCGACIVDVEEGLENLSERNKLELDLSLEEDQRLACQTKIKTGTVKIDL